MKKVPHKYVRHDGNRFTPSTISFTIDIDKETYGVYEVTYPDVPMFIQLRYLVQRKHELLMYGGRVKLKERT